MQASPRLPNGFVFEGLSKVKLAEKTRGNHWIDPGYLAVFVGCPVSPIRERMFVHELLEKGK